MGASAEIQSEISELGKRLIEVTDRFTAVDNVNPQMDRSDISNPIESDLTDVRESLVCLLQDMLQKVQGPTRTLIDMTNTARVRLSLLRTIVHFDLVGKVPEAGSVAFDELASITAVDRSLLERVLRFAFSQGIFQETSPGHGTVSHTELSRAIPLLAPWFQLVLSATCLCRRQQSSRDPHDSKTAVEIAFKKPFYAVIKSDSHLRLFQDGLKSLSMAQKVCWWSHESDLFPWEEQPKSVIVDVGGGNGQTAVEIARKNPDLHFVVQDLEENRTQAEQTIPPDLQKRVLFQAHDIFTVQRRIFQQPVTFFMKWILHNWSDDRCIEILTHLVPLLVLPGSRLLVQEYVLSESTYVRAMDMTMLTFFTSGARERTVQDFDILFQQVDRRMRIAKVWEADEMGMKILEVIVA
ncbi:hypothetical protein H2200_013603 [Cladophialophora chaetospira]|uniref:O-methyltransferase C-terminal domain-containing protein n=1 Tax=Cladophialophora chaetospira TaxID=386627 RepID=A0AA38UE22_9EURO|nr:hypothetical protein H2200_013603 [Cladophialophora chaetospira]